ncbi:MAG: tRNA (guanosine(37)-N1)-methyltransferase TrmD [Weeksellaceae bacterium]
MKISIITLFPNMLKGFFAESIVKKAQEKKLVEIEIIDLRLYALDKYGTVDDRPYGGGAGMVLRIEPLKEAIDFACNDKLKKCRTVLTSAKGARFNQEKANKYVKLDHLVVIAGHYEGFDDRVTSYIDEEVSIGDFILTGGEIVAAAITDSVIRLIPGVLKKEEATVEESFYRVRLLELMDVVGNDPILMKLEKKGETHVQLLEYPHYTRPEVFEEKHVPEILMSGDHEAVRKWRLKKAYEQTVKKRPDLLDK